MANLAAGKIVNSLLFCPLSNLVKQSTPPLRALTPTSHNQGHPHQECSHAYPGMGTPRKQMSIHSMEILLLQSKCCTPPSSVKKCYY